MEQRVPSSSIFQEQKERPTSFNTITATPTPPLPPTPKCPFIPIMPNTPSPGTLPPPSAMTGTPAPNPRVPSSPKRWRDFCLYNTILPTKSPLLPRPASASPPPPSPRHPQGPHHLTEAPASASAAAASTPRKLFINSAEKMDYESTIHHSCFLLPGSDLFHPPNASSLPLPPAPPPQPQHFCLML
ncbi:uncharacterized protein LOC135197639 [Macrobrachium nipponense]|uniref:uncharacterized protein LOC135197639 n=1 Tax=Macrobrachium nipponense TaxID=159736 RepID=UPI0030C83AC9